MREDESPGSRSARPAIVRLRASLDEDGGVVDWVHDAVGQRSSGSARPRRTGRHVRPACRASPREAAYPAVAPRPSSPGAGGGRNAAPCYDFPNQRVVNHYVALHPDPRVGAALARRPCATSSPSSRSSMRSPLRRAWIRLPTACGTSRIPVPAPSSKRFATPPTGRPVRRLTTVAASASGSPVQEHRLLRGGRRRGEIGDELGLHPCLGHGRRRPRRQSRRSEQPGRGRDPAGGELDAQGRGPLRLLEGQLDHLGHVPDSAIQRGPGGRVSALIDRPDEPPLGVGEAIAGPTAAAIGNAFFAATGVRLRDMPFTRERILGRCR